MSTEYAGLPAVARRFWYVYSLAVISGITMLIFTGAIAAVIVLLVAPDAVTFFLIASVSYILHNAALFVTDLRTGDFEPSQSSLSMTPKELLALIIVMGTYQSTTLLVATSGALAFQSVLGIPAAFAAVAAAYYPVADLVLMRRGWPTPGEITVRIVIALVDAILNIRELAVGSLPVIGKRRRAQR